MSEGLTKQQTITRLSEIDPVWAKILAKRNWNNWDAMNELRGRSFSKSGRVFSRLAYVMDGTKMYSLGEPCCCIVGESYNGDDSYYFGNDTDHGIMCNKCYKFSMIFGTSRFCNISLHYEEEWIKYLNKFIDHFEAKHQ